MEILDIILIVFGIITILGVIFKPDIYWNRGRLRQTREIIGDRNTTILYLVVGIIMLGVGLYFGLT
ncbi:MAG: hypothetical protein D6835_02955 [Candidatus Thermofonsia bacterium]|nr:MAG: hypothetical protein D6835_02955 [Candidatus Thermofonsia bacterium]